MRIFEIASAEEQLALWKLISTSVWTAIEQQLQQQRQEVTAKVKQAEAKSKFRGSKAASPRTAFMPRPVSPRLNTSLRIQEPSSHMSTGTDMTQSKMNSQANSAGG
jgi:hypothetical protein